MSDVTNGPELMTLVERLLIDEASHATREAPTSMRARVVAAIERSAATPMPAGRWARRLGAAVAVSATIGAGTAAWLVQDAGTETTAWTFLPVTDMSTEWPRQAREMPSQWETMLRGEARLVVLDARNAGNRVLDRLMIDSLRPVVWSGSEGGR